MVLRVNKEVLARFSDDGWFYFGVARKKNIKEKTYTVLDGAGNCIDIPKIDILLDEEEGYQGFATLEVCTNDW